MVAFEDNPNDIIETQVESFAVQALVQRADALKQSLLEKGLTPLEIPEHPSSQ